MRRLWIRDGRINQIGAPLTARVAILFGAGQPVVADNISGQNRGECPNFRPCRLSGAIETITEV